MPTLFGNRVSTKKGLKMATDWDKSTWTPPPPPTSEEVERWRQDPRNHVTPGLQEITPSKAYNEISRKPRVPPAAPRERKPSTENVYH